MKFGKCCQRGVIKPLQLLYVGKRDFFGPEIKMRSHANGMVQEIHAGKVRRRSAFHRSDRFGSVVKLDGAVNRTSAHWIVGLSPLGDRGFPHAVPQYSAASDGELSVFDHDQPGIFMAEDHAEPAPRHQDTSLFCLSQLPAKPAGPQRERENHRHLPEMQNGIRQKNMNESPSAGPACFPVLNRNRQIIDI